MTPPVEWGSVSNTGRVRDHNEDAVLIEPPIFAVADGMGGHAAGEVAADLALGIMRPLASQSSVKADDIAGAVEAANEAIVAWTLEQSETLGMGTTMAGVCLGMVGGTQHWIVFNVGDSRVYRFNGRGLEQLTTDHSEVQELVAAGQITVDEARVHPNRNIITRSLGSQPAPSPDIWVVPAQGAETFLICSDGLTTEVPDDVIGEVLALGWGAQQTADELCRRALDAGGRDNISIVIVRLPVAARAEVDVATGPRPERSGPPG